MKSQIEGVCFFPVAKLTDERGWLMELFRNDQLYDENHPQMAYVSMTKPGVTRGPHEHVLQSDLFVFIGPGDFELHLWEKQKTDMQNDYILHEKYLVGESEPMGVIVPPGVIHAYKNMSNGPGIVFNAPNELYAGPGKKYPVDEIRHEEGPTSHFYVIN